MVEEDPALPSGILLPEAEEELLMHSLVAAKISTLAVRLLLGMKQLK